jgi:hypothetical protein
MYSCLKFLIGNFEIVCDLNQVFKITVPHCVVIVERYVPQTIFSPYNIFVIETLYCL